MCDTVFKDPEYPQDPASDTQLRAHQQCLPPQVERRFGYHSRWPQQDSIHVMRIHHAQRKHIIHSLDALLYQLHTLSFFLSPALWVYLARVISQFQFSRPRQMDPKRSLRFWFMLAFLFNVGAVWTHALDSGQAHRSVIVDFVGMGRPPSKAHVLFLDALIVFLEMLLTTIAYETALAHESTPTDTDSTPSDIDVDTPNTPLFGDGSITRTRTESEYIVDIHFPSLLQRLRSPPPPPPSPQADTENSLLPLPNTTPWQITSSLRVVMQARARAREDARRDDGRAATERDGQRRIPGELDVNERS